MKSFNIVNSYLYKYNITTNRTKMKFFKLITIISFIVLLLSSCGRSGARIPYKGYPKTYPSVNTKAVNTPKLTPNKK